jgi:glucokinase
MMVLACDLGGTRMKIGVVRDGVVLAQTVEPANSRQGLAPQLPVLKAACLRLLAGLNFTTRDCAGFSVAFPSLVDTKTGRVRTEYGKFADAMNLDLRDWSQRELGLPLAIENDARMALIGEWRAGAGRGCNNLVLITLGTGLGVCAMIEGRLMRGKHDQAGVLGGHMTVRYDGGRECSCGNAGCAEAEASTAYLAVMAKDRPDFATSTLARDPVLDFAAVFKHARSGDPCALALRDHSIHVWATLVVNMIHVCDPEIVILGGGIMASADVILPAIRQHVSRRAHTPWGKVQVVASALGEKAALVAGEWLIHEQFPELKS